MRLPRSKSSREGVFRLPVPAALSANPGEGQASNHMAGVVWLPGRWRANILFLKHFFETAVRMYRGEAMKRTLLFLCAVAILVAVPAAAAPPHPDLMREIREGLRPEPAYLQRLRTEGPKVTGRERSALETMRARKIIPPAAARTAPFAEEGGRAAPQTFQTAAPPAAGTPKVLVLLFSFSDVAGGVTASYFDTLVFGASSPSVSHYFLEASGGAFGLSTDDLPSSTGWLSRTASPKKF